MSISKTAFSAAFFAALFIIESGTAFAFQPEDFIQDAVSLEITGKGFDTLSGVVEKQFSGYLAQQKVSDMDLELPLIARIAVQDIGVLGDFKNVKITPSRNGLALSLDVYHLELNVGKVAVSNYWIPALQTTCTDTRISFGNGSPIHIRANLGVEFKHGQIQLRDKGIQFQLDPEHYLASGPSKCTGGFALTDQIVQSAVRGMLASARPAINMTLQGAAKVLTSQLGDLLLANIKNMELPLTIPANKMLPQTRLVAGLNVRDLQVTPEGLKLKFDFAVKKKQSRTFAQSDDSLPILFRLGTLGLNPKLIERLVDVIFDHGATSIEITPETFEMAAELLKIRTLSSFLPDLQNAQVDSERIRLILSLPEASKFSFGEEENLLASLPNVSLKILVQQQGEWKDYFTLHLGLETSIKAAIKDGKIKVSPKILTLKSWGEWANTYQPQDQAFLNQEFEGTIQALVDIVAAEGAALDLPKFQTENGNVSVDHLRIEKPYLFLDVILGQNH